MNEIINAFPLFSIIICFVGAVVSSFSNRKVAFILSLTVCSLVIFLTSFVLAYTLKTNEAIIYTMGHFGPNEDGIRICNEIRVGPLEAFLAIFFATVLMLVIISGKVFQDEDINHKKQNLYYVMMCLILVSNISLLYTNDIFTGFVFIEVSTLASCGCLMVKEKGPTILSTVRYMIFNLVGSGLFLIGIVILYDLTGYLSIENIATAVSKVAETEQLKFPLHVSFALIIAGLSIKSGLFPFHFWMPDAYGGATPSSSSILSGIVTKGYLFLLIKVIYRMLTIEVLRQTYILEALFVLGVLGMIVGSINAIHQKSIDRMTAFSSAAQIGYIFMGIGLSSYIGIKSAQNIAFVAFIFHILTHCVTKSLLFISTGGLVKSAGGAKKFRNLRGIGRFDKLSAATYSVGALSMIGFPLFAGFISKYFFVSTALEVTIPVWMKVIAVVALIVSTVLNAIYFVRTMLTIYLRKETSNTFVEKIKYKPTYVVGVILLASINVFLGVGSTFIVEIINKGFHLFV